MNDKTVCKATNGYEFIVEACDDISNQKTIPNFQPKKNRFATTVENGFLKKLNIDDPLFRFKYG